MSIGADFYNFTKVLRVRLPGGGGVRKPRSLTSLSVAELLASKLVLHSLLSDKLSWVFRLKQLRKEVLRF